MIATRKIPSAPSLSIVLSIALSMEAADSPLHSPAGDARKVALRLGMALALILGLGLASIPSARGAGQEVDHAHQYEACMRLVKRNAADAFESALAWADLGGGDAAQHCAAIALFEMGKYDHAARRMQLIAESSTSLEAPLRADLLAQAAQGWMLSENLPQAEAALDAAIKLKPRDPELFIDRGMIRGQRADYQGSLADLQRAIIQGTTRPAAFVYRASARRHLGQLQGALEDADEALRLEPKHPDALLERGLIYRALGRLEPARQDWLEVVLTHPNSPVAEAAQRYIEDLAIGRR